MKNLDMKIEIEENLPEITGDNKRLLEVIENLFSNAVKFTEKGQILIKVWKENKDIIVCFQDTGKGINPKYKDIIFEKFRQLGDIMTEKPEGIGVGLSICRIIIEFHHGKLWLESEPDKGSSFYFSLPVYEKIL